ncbi:MAG TPA: Crp/Fnr family transcriptional regulator [Burkholderiaceae bacterium]
MAEHKDKTPSTPQHAVKRSSLALRHIALFQGLSEDRLEHIANDCDWHSIAARKPLFTRAQNSNDVYFLASGRVRVTTYSAQGRQVTFRDCEAGEHFGDLAALDGQPRSADVVTLEPSLLASLSPAAFRALLRAEPLVAERVVLYLTALVRQLSERVIDLSTLGVQNRLHAELLRLAIATGVQDNQARITPAPPHAALASQISTNREQVTRELGALTRCGLLRKEGRALVVTDVARLTSMVAEVRGA